MKVFWKRIKLLPVRSLRYMEGDEGGEGEGEGEGQGEGEKTFTQKQVDDMIQKRVGREKKEKEALVAQLEQFKSSQKLTTEERDNLQKHIDALENSMLTKDEQTAKEKKQALEKHAKELGVLQQQSDLWKNRYESSMIDRALSDAAVSADAESPEQIQMMFRQTSYLSEDKGEDGKATGTFTPRMKVTLPVKDGEGMEEIDLPVSQALAKLKEAGLHKNLFRHGGTGGTGTKPSGQGTGGDSKMPDPSKYSSNIEYSRAYQEWRQKYEVDGTPKRTQNV